jgi:arabinose-5-phosphate isomerase
MDYLLAARKVFTIEREELERVADRLGDEFCKACDAIRTCIENRGKIVVLGVGKSGHIGDKIAATLTSTGSPAVVLNSLNALHGDLGVIADGDIVLALSYGGETEELLNILPALKRFEVLLIAVTGKAQSSLARASDIVLDVSIEREACPLGLAPTSSTTAMLVLGDALAMVVLEARGFRKEDFARFHPGGSVGRALLTKVADIMRPRDAIPILSPQSSVVQVIRSTTRCRTGAAIIENQDGSLAGIFTQGDFARHFPSHPDLAHRPVSEFMTPSPVTVHENSLAAEVLHILRTHRVDDLIVINHEGHPVGLVDSQDLSRLKMF